MRCCMRQITNNNMQQVTLNIPFFPELSWTANSILLHHYHPKGVNCQGYSTLSSFCPLITDIPQLNFPSLSWHCFQGVWDELKGMRHEHAHTEDILALTSKFHLVMSKKIESLMWPKHQWWWSWYLGLWLYNGMWGWAREMGNSYSQGKSDNRQLSLQKKWGHDEG